MRFISLFLIFLLIFSIMMTGQLQARETIFSISDPVGDDTGPGSYNYPRHSDFFPYQKLLDINNFSIEQTEEYYYLIFSFEKLTNPWNKKYGFSHPLIELYIDNQSGGSGSSFQDAARINFTDGFYWNQLLKISGEFVRLYYPEDEEQKEQLIDITGDILYPDWEVQDFNLRTRDNEIILQISQNELGPLREAEICLLIGSFNPFGPGYFREIRTEQNNWFIYDQTLDQQELNYAPRVMDIILPADKEQQEVLGSFSRGEFVEVYPLNVEMVSEEQTFIGSLSVWMRVGLLSLLLVLALIAGIIYRNRSGKMKGQG